MNAPRTSGYAVNLSAASRPTVALVVPNYNHGRYLAESLGSIAAQTLQPDEVLIIDDASTDDSCEVIAEFTRLRPSWRVLARQERMGVIRGQNEALELTSASWIGFLGADDILHQAYLEKAVAAASTLPADANLVCACVKLIGVTGTDVLRPAILPSLVSQYIPPAAFRACLETGDNFFAGTATLYRRQALADVGGFEAELGSVADGLLGRQFAARGGFYFIAEALGYWRLHDTNYSSTSVTNARELDRLIANTRKAVMTEQPGVFPAHYADMLERRLRFGGGRLLISNNNLAPNERAQRVAEICRLAPWERRLLAFALSFGYFGDAAAIVWLTVRLRPMSVPKYMRQWWARRAIVATESPGKAT
ncbi:hypothetical protein ASD45_14410 [Pseudolabrys sp. Root1462]|uniref:glycosyltransferase family 2 protein n=1 Tax=Pseudolabrys sp. Root1462 TaxID=1736466 RepID=UPI000702547C|nr:glycosyltransferase family 2 protein [Pseudolabrys sp. Root1462]KQZ01911.1 hypothetical protein ASD45_14410 [Pseudolabrys sp. Root1462]